MQPQLESTALALPFLKVKESKDDEKVDCFDDVFIDGGMRV